MNIFQEIAKAWHFFREQGVMKTITSREAPFLIQFGKYGICGVLSVVVFFIVTELGRAIYPAPFAETLPDSLRARNNVILHFIAFLPSNFTAYFLNRWLVFTPGRHTFGKEMALFTLISLISFTIGEFIPHQLVSNLGIPNRLADLSFIISSALINFICRKFLVFEK